MGAHTIAGKTFADPKKWVGYGLDPTSPLPMTGVPGLLMLSELGLNAYDSLKHEGDKQKRAAEASDIEAKKLEEDKANLLRNRPDMTDEAVLEARRRQAQLLMAGNGRKSTFLTGPLGDISSKPLGRKTLLGG